MKRNTDPPTVLSRLHCNVGRQRPQSQQTLLNIVIRWWWKGWKRCWVGLHRPGSLAAYAGSRFGTRSEGIQCKSPRKTRTTRISPASKTAQLPSYSPCSPPCDADVMECLFAVAFHRCDGDPEGSRRNNFGSSIR